MAEGHAPVALVSTDGACQRARRDAIVVGTVLLVILLQKSPQSLQVVTAMEISSGSVHKFFNQYKGCFMNTEQEAQQLLGWPHQRENDVSDGGGLTRP